ncbi:hypothetical protein LTR08_005406 [Meristemomyces frigidus]|nr:hypothetical protein LTR08_005406 [Meristemomyces frigidus]
MTSVPNAARGYYVFQTRRLPPNALLTQVDFDGLLRRGYNEATHGGLLRLQDTEDATVWRSVNLSSVSRLSSSNQHRTTVLSVDQNFYQANPAWSPTVTPPQILPPPRHSEQPRVNSTSQAAQGAPTSQTTRVDSTSQAAQGATTTHDDKGSEKSKHDRQPLGDYTKLYKSFEDATNAFYQPIRQPFMQDESLASINTDKFVAEVYDAIRTVPASMTPAQSKMLLDMQNKISRLETPTSTLTQVANMVVEAFVNLYTHGNFLRPDQWAFLRPSHADCSMNAEQRKTFILSVLKSTKRIAFHLLDGKHAVVDFVAAPDECNRRIMNNKGVNDRRALRKKQRDAENKAQEVLEVDSASDGPPAPKKVKSSVSTPTKSRPKGRAYAATTTPASRSIFHGSSRKRSYSTVEYADDDGAEEDDGVEKDGMEEDGTDDHDCVEISSSDDDVAEEGA